MRCVISDMDCPHSCKAFNDASLARFTTCSVGRFSKGRDSYLPSSVFCFRNSSVRATCRSSIFEFSPAHQVGKRLVNLNEYKRVHKVAKV